VSEPESAITFKTKIKKQKQNQIGAT